MRSIRTLPLNNRALIKPGCHPREADISTGLLERVEELRQRFLRGEDVVRDGEWWVNVEAHNKMVLSQTGNKP